MIRHPLSGAPPVDDSMVDPRSRALDVAREAARSWPVRPIPAPPVHRPAVVSLMAGVLHLVGQVANGLANRLEGRTATPEAPTGANWPY
jgi:hypothetical protein